MITLYTNALSAIVCTTVVVLCMQNLLGERRHTHKKLLAGSAILALAHIILHAQKHTSVFTLPPEELSIAWAVVDLVTVLLLLGMVRALTNRFIRK